jgi:hypothetical protein
LYHRKSSLSRRRAAVGLQWTFAGEDGPVSIKRATLADVPDLADRLSTKDRLQALLRRGPVAVAEVTTALDVKPETLKKTLQRFPNMFIKRLGADGEPRLALVEHRHGE